MLLLLLDAPSDLVLFIVQVYFDCVDVVLLPFLSNHSYELFLFNFEVNRWGSLGHAARGVGAKPEKVSEDVADLVVLLILSVSQLLVLILELQEFICIY